MAGEEPNYREVLERLVEAIDRADISFSSKSAAEDKTEFEEALREAREALDGYTESEA